MMGVERRAARPSTVESLSLANGQLRRSMSHLRRVAANDIGFSLDVATHCGRDFRLVKYEAMAIGTVVIRSSTRCAFLALDRVTINRSKGMPE